MTENFASKSDSGLKLVSPTIEENFLIKIKQTYCTHSAIAG